jgi:molybdate transport system ATP-binding protein
MVEGAVSNAGLIAGFRASRGSFLVEMSLTVPPGETVALLGPNGAGKSTAVAALAGLLAIDEGSVELAGTTLDDPSRNLFVPPELRSVGVMFQEYLLFPHMSVAENVAFGLRSRGVAREEAIERAARWLERLGLLSEARSKPGALSGGQAQRVALARALVIEPDLLLLDEPLSALDVTTRVQMRRVLAEHLETFAGPRLLITHDPTEAFLLGDAIHIIEDGHITQSGTAHDIRLRPRSPYAADLAGSNLIFGMAADGVVEVGLHAIHIADHDIAGPVLVTIRPAAISVHLREPESSARNAWKTTVELVEDLGDRTRLMTGEPLALTVEITTASAAELGIAEGSMVWVSIKATDIGVSPDQSGPG